MSGQYTYGEHADSPVDLLSIPMGSADRGPADATTSALSVEFSLQVLDDTDAGLRDASRTDFSLSTSSDEAVSPTAVPPLLDSPSPPLSQQPSLTQSKSKSRVWEKSTQSSRSWQSDGMDLVNLASTRSGATFGSVAQSTRSNPYADVLASVDGALYSVNNSMDSSNLPALSRTLAGGRRESLEGIGYEGSFASAAGLAETTNSGDTPTTMRRLSRVGGRVTSYDVNSPAAAAVARRSSNASATSQGLIPATVTHSSAKHVARGTGHAVNSLGATGSRQVSAAGAGSSLSIRQNSTTGEVTAERLSLSLPTSADFPAAQPSPPPERQVTVAASDGKVNAAWLPRPPVSPAVSSSPQKERASAAAAAAAAGVGSLAGRRAGPAPTFLGVQRDDDEGDNSSRGQYHTFFESMGWRSDSSPSLTRVRSDESVLRRAGARRMERVGGDGSNSPTGVPSGSPGSPAWSQRRASSEPTANRSPDELDGYLLPAAIAQPAAPLSPLTHFQRNGRRVRGACDEGYGGERLSVGTAFTREPTYDLGDAVADNDEINLADSGDDYGGFLAPRNAAQARLLHHLIDQPSPDAAAPLQDRRSLAGRALVKPLNTAASGQSQASRAPPPPPIPAPPQSRPAFSLASVRLATSAALAGGAKASYAFDGAAPVDGVSADSLFLSTSLGSTIRLSRTTALENSLSLSSRTPRPPSRHTNRAGFLGEVVTVSAQSMPASPRHNRRRSSAGPATTAPVTSSDSNSSAVIDLRTAPRSRGTRQSGSGSGAAASGPASAVPSASVTVTTPGTRGSAPSEWSVNETPVAASRASTTPRSSKNEPLRTIPSAVRIRTSIDQGTTCSSATPGAAWPLGKADVSIIVRCRVFDPCRRRLRGPRTRSLPNGRRRADWAAPETHYTTTLADLAMFEDEPGEGEEGEDEEQTQQQQALGEGELVTPMANGAARVDDSVWHDEDVEVDVPASSTRAQRTARCAPPGETPAIPKGVAGASSAASPAAPSHASRAAPLLPIASSASPLLRALGTGARVFPPPMASFSPITLAFSSQARPGAMRDSLNTSHNNSRRPTGIVVDEVEKVLRLREDCDFTPVLDELGSDHSSTRTRGGAGLAAPPTSLASPLAGQERRTSRRPFTPHTGSESSSARTGGNASGHVFWSESHRLSSSTADPYGLLAASPSTSVTPTFARIITHSFGAPGDLESVHRPASPRSAESGVPGVCEARKSAVTFSEPPSFSKTEKRRAVA